MNPTKGGFAAETSFRWKKSVEGVTVTSSSCARPTKSNRGRSTSRTARGPVPASAFNVRGAQLVARAYLEREIEAGRLDGGGRSWVTVRVANILSYTVLKVLAFQDRHENKDSYGLVYCLLNFGEGPDDAGRVAAQSAARDESQVVDALQLLAERFESADNDGPHRLRGFPQRG